MSFTKSGLIGTSLTFTLTCLLTLAAPTNAAGIRGDFNGDGYSDLVVANTSESFFDEIPGNGPNVIFAGSVHIMYGSADSLTSKGSQFIHQDTPGVLGIAEQNDNFGTSLVAADFNGDGYSDLAIGASSEDLFALANSGSVNVLYGSSEGISTINDQYFHQNSRGIKGVAEEEDRFGGSLAAADFNGDGFADLAIGVGGEDVGAIADAGAVNVIYGSKTGLSSSGNQLWHQNNPTLLDSAEPSDFFGARLTAADFDGDGYADLVVGLPGEQVGASDKAGSVHVIRGGINGLHGFQDQIFHQNTPGVKGIAESEDKFGTRLTVGDFDGNGRPDLAIGVPSEGIAGQDRAGAVNVLYSRPGFGLTTVGNQIWHQNSTDIQDEAEKGDLFGIALASGDFDNDGYFDLAIGVSQELPAGGQGLGDGGAVAVLLGSPDGITSAGNLFFASVGASTHWDNFGGALAVGNFNGDQHADLAIGSDGDGIGGGRLVVLNGNNSGPNDNEFMEWDQYDPNLFGSGQGVWDRWTGRLTSQ